MATSDGVRRAWRNGAQVLWSWAHGAPHRCNAVQNRWNPETAIWSLCVSFGDLVTHVLDPENHSDQIAV